MTVRILLTALLWFSLAAFGPAQTRSLQVVDAESGIVIPDAIVVADGTPQLQNSTGSFDVRDNLGLLFARAPGYRAGSFELAALPHDGRLSLVPFVPHAVYLSVRGVGSSVLLGGALALAQKGGINALVVDVKGDNGFIPYPSAVPLAQQDGAQQFTSIPDLTRFVRMLHAKGLYAIARVVTFKDNELASFAPTLAVHIPGGGLYRDKEGMAWTDPFQPQVQAYNIAIAVEAARAGFDEIQFDYLRFPDTSTRLDFLKPVTEQSRVAAIGAFLTEVHQQLMPYNVYVAADIFGYVCWNGNDTGIGQTLAAIEPNVDYISPMLYPSGFQFGIPGYRNPVTHAYDVVYLSLVQAQRRLGIPKNRFRPWLQAFKDYAFDHRDFSAQEVGEQIRAAKNFGTDGWMLWNPRNDYSKVGLATPKAAVPASNAIVVPPALVEH